MKFSDTIRPLFSNKIKSVDKFLLDKSGDIIWNEKEAENVFENYFWNIVPNMALTNNYQFSRNTDTSDNP